jgi:hypothetical protein
MHKARGLFLTEGTKKHNYVEKQLTFFVKNDILNPYKSAKAQICKEDIIMKKVCSAMLAILLVLSLTLSGIVLVAAEGKSQTIVVSEGEDVAADQKAGNAEGWRNSKVDAGKAPLSVMELDGEKGAGGTITGSAENYHATIRFLYYTNTPIDISGMKYIEFDFYYSDASKFTSANEIMFELTSSGQQDKAEISTTIKPKLESGWNHIKIAIADLRTGSPEPFEATAWNFFRLCINGPYNLGSDTLTMAIDNLKFWDGLNADGLDEEEEKRQELLAKVQPTLDAIDLLKTFKNKGDVTADNYATVKANVEAAYVLYNALNEEEKAMVTEEGGFKILKTAQRLVEDYEEKNPPAEEKPEEKPNEGDTNNGENNTQEPTDTKGCGGVLTVGAVATMLLAGAWVTVFARKKND